MQVTYLHFLYKGERDYIHGTDMYETIVDIVRTANPETTTGTFRMTIHDIVRHQCQLMYSDWSGVTSKPDNSKVEFNCFSDSVRIIGWLVETMNPVVERYQYREEEIVERCSISEKTITIDSETSYSAIEVLVAMNKYLHLSLFPHVDGKWFFTRLDLERLLRPSDASRFQVEFIQNLHTRLTKSRIWSEGEMMGHIYFSLVKQ